jgi:predicted aminopeptidase
MDPRSFLALARTLVASATGSDGSAASVGPAECRSAISRAYYASFLVGLDFLRSLGFQVTDSGDCHTVVQYALNNSGDTDLIIANSQLGTLASERRKADYRMNDASAESVEQAQAMLQIADKTVQLLDKSRTACATASKRTGIVNAIVAWAALAGQQKKISLRSGR